MTFESFEALCEFAMRHFPKAVIFDDEEGEIYIGTGYRLLGDDKLEPVKSDK